MPVRPVHLPREPRRILLVKPSALGDIVHTLPVLALLRKRFRAARISWLVAPAFAALLDGHPMVDELIRFERRAAKESGPLASASAFLDLMRDLSGRSFDLAIDLQGLMRSALLTWATGAPVRVGFGYAREGAPFAYTHRVPHHGGVERHAIERYLDVAEALGCPRGPVEFPFHVTNADRAAVDDLIAGVGPFAVILPGTNWVTKKWPAEYFGAIAPRIESEFGLRVVLAGAKDVVGLAARMSPSVIDLAARTSLPQLVELLRRASLVIANDSGPMHVASAVGAPLVTVFGPTNHVRTGPYQRDDTVLRLNLPCAPCYSRGCSHRVCLDWLTPDHVMASARIQVEKAQRRSRSQSVIRLATC